MSLRKVGWCCSLVIVMLHACILTLHAQRRAIVPSDCLNIQYIDQDSVTVSRDGSLLLYTIKASSASADPDIKRLYLMDLRKGGSQREVLAGERISHITWLRDGRHALMLMREGATNSIVNVDVITGHVESVTQTPRDVLEYSSDRDGSVIVFTTLNLDLGKTAPTAIDSNSDRNGYHISFDRPIRKSQQVVNLLYRTNLDKNGRWTTPVPITFSDPYTGEQLVGTPGLRYLSLSPDGQKLLFNYPTEHFPDSFSKSPIRRGGMGGTVLYDLISGKTTLPMPLDDGVWSIPKWASDSRSFIALAKPPVGSTWEQRDVAEHFTEGADVDMYWIEPGSGKIQEVYHHAPDDHQGPLAWLDDGDVIAQTSARTVTHFHRDGEFWRQLSSIVIPIDNYYRFSFSGLTTADGKTIIGVYETPTIAPDIFVYDSAHHQLQKETKLNPDLEHLRIAPFQTIHWKTSTGYDISGFLFMPPDYIPGHRYPLVIQTKGSQGWFVCDAGSRPAPGFQPQPMANAGIMYLMRTVPEDWKQSEEIAQYPKNYPGQLGEVANQMDIWESAVTTLDERGLIDPTKVGIMGYSRTGWVVEFMLAHSKISFAAASADDNVQFSLGEYWLRSNPSKMRQYDEMYGGPPYGKTLKNWLDYSISFNLDQVHTPLLLELMGYGVRDDVPGMIPDNLATEYEVFSGLSILGKPVDLYYYPTGVHKMDEGESHVANLNRDLDWYRFWLQDYKDPNPDKRQQYERWEHLRALHYADLTRTGGRVDNSLNH